MPVFFDLLRCQRPDYLTHNDCLLSHFYFTPIGAKSKLQGVRNGILYGLEGQCPAGSSAGWASFESYCAEEGQCGIIGSRGERTLRGER